MDATRVKRSGWLQRQAIAVLVAAAVLTGYGCGSDATGPVTDISGRYELQTIGGKKLPAQVGAAMWYSYSLLTLHANGTYSRLDVFTGSAFPFTGSDGGTYARTSEKLLLFDSYTEDSFQAELSGTTITSGSPHGIAVYRRVSGL